MLVEVPKSVIAQNIFFPITEGASFEEIHVSGLVELENLMEVEGLQKTIEQTLDQAEWKVCAYKRFLAERCFTELGIDLIAGSSESQTRMKYFPETIVDEEGSCSVYCARLSLIKEKSVPYSFIDKKIVKSYFCNGKIFFYIEGHPDNQDALVFSLEDGQCSIPNYLV